MGAVKTMVQKGSDVEFKLIKPTPFWIFIVTCTDCGFITTNKMKPPLTPFQVKCQACGAFIEVNPTRAHIV